MDSPWKGKYGPLLIAEIGGNHEGDYSYAQRLVDLALESDADVIKLQIYRGDTLVSRVESETRNKHFKRFELSESQYLALAEHISSAGKTFMASIWSVDLIDFIDHLMPIYKIGSGDLTSLPLLKEFASRSKPIILSTGLSTGEEVVEAVNALREANPIYADKHYLAVLQCTSMYPIPFSDANLNVISTLSSKTGATVGYSDHTEGLFALQIATAMGAEVLEFHFTDSRDNKDFRDHKVSLTVEEVRVLQQRLKEIGELKGSAVKSPLAVEGDHVTTFRRALYPKYNLPAGSILTAENTILLRPNLGIDARYSERAFGRRLKTDIIAHQRLEWDMLES